VAKKPGVAMAGQALELFVCNAATDEVGAYERLIGAALEGDTTLFARDDGVLEAWRIVDPVLTSDTPPEPYAVGTYGPAAADAQLAPGDVWHVPQAG
jgi:glucose-6-phosphate 1-dehydrogenase